MVVDFPLSTVWAPMLAWPSAYVPKVRQGVREWDKDGPAQVPLVLGVPQLGITYRWRGPRLVCVNCPDG